MQYVRVNEKIEKKFVFEQVFSCQENIKFIDS